MLVFISDIVNFTNNDDGDADGVNDYTKNIELQFLEIMIVMILLIIKVWYYVFDDKKEIFGEQWTSN